MLRNHYYRNHFCHILPYHRVHFYSWGEDCGPVPLGSTRYRDQNHIPFGLCSFLGYCYCLLSFNETMKFLLQLHKTTFGFHYTLDCSTFDSFQSLGIVAPLVSFKLPSFSFSSCHGEEELLRILHRSWHRILGNFNFIRECLIDGLLQRPALYFALSYLGYFSTCHSTVSPFRSLHQTTGCTL